MKWEKALEERQEARTDADDLYMRLKYIYSTSEAHRDILSQIGMECDTEMILPPAPPMPSMRTTDDVYPADDPKAAYLQDIIAREKMEHTALLQIECMNEQMIAKVKHIQAQIANALGAAL